MRWMSVGLLFVILCSSVAARAQEPGAEPREQTVTREELSRRLAELVAIVDPGKRRTAADEFAKSKEYDLERMREAMAAFGVFEREKPGTSSVEVPLWTGSGSETTRLHLYVPKGYDPGKPAPMLVIGHWTGGRGDRTLPTWVPLADRTGMLLLAATEAGRNEGWAFSVRERESARSAIRYMRRRFNVDENRIFCTGVSRGGHMAWDLALRYPDLFAAIAPMIGGPRIKRVQGQNNLRYLENVVDLPIRDLQGARDDPYLVSNLRLAFKMLRELKARDAKLIEFPEMGHSYDMSAVDWNVFFGQNNRNPRPERVVRMMATQGETRAFWLDVLQKDKTRVKVVPQIPASAKFQKLDEHGQREYVARAVERRTARLEAKILGKGRFFAKGRHVRSFRILLDPSMFVAGKPVLVKYKARQRRLPVKPSKRVLCREFAERFDRTFLPVAEVILR